MSGVEQRMAQLEARFLERCKADRVTLSCALDRDQQIEIAHRISGSAGIFGFAGLGAAAQGLEEALRAGDRDAALLKNRLLAELGALQAR